MLRRGLRKNSSLGLLFFFPFNHRRHAIGNAFGTRGHNERSDLDIIMSERAIDLARAQYLMVMSAEIEVVYCQRCRAFPAADPNCLEFMRLLPRYVMKRLT